MTNGCSHQTSGRWVSPIGRGSQLESTHDNTKRLAALRVSGVGVMGHSPRGFTLIEIMVTVAVAVILLAVAVPNYINFMRSNRLSTSVNTFVQALQLARLEARGRGATLCASTGKVDATSKHEECDTTEWGQGWIVFSDSTFDGVPNGGDEILRVGAAFPEELVIKAGATAKVKFGRQGFSVPAGTTYNFEFCVKGFAAGRNVAVNIAGSPSTLPITTCPVT